MSLDLDERQRGMLAEMGIRWWAPEAAQEVQAAPVPLAVQRAAQPARVPVPQPVEYRPAAPAQPPQAPQAPQARPAAAQLRPLPEGIAQMGWPALREAVAGCQACRLCESRRNTVFGTGDENADLLIVGEAPHESEDLQGEPFVGPAGKLLDNMLKAAGLQRHSKVFIASVVRCRPPGNRNPEPGELAQCDAYLRRQVELIKPKVILAMGRFAVQSMLQPQEPMGRLRGRAHEYHGVPVVVTYHPDSLLRTPLDKSKAWADLCLAMDTMASVQAVGNGVGNGL